MDHSFISLSLKSTVIQHDRLASVAFATTKAQRLCPPGEVVRNFAARADSIRSRR